MGMPDIVNNVVKIAQLELFNIRCLKSSLDALKRSTKD